MARFRIRRILNYFITYEIANAYVSSRKERKKKKSPRPPGNDISRQLIHVRT